MTRLWLLISLVAFVRDLPKTKFNLNMWSTAYPIGTYGVASSQFAIDFDSIAFRVITTIILIISVIYWFYLIIYTLPMILSGEAFLGALVEEKGKRGERKEGGG